MVGFPELWKGIIADLKAKSAELGVEIDNIRPILPMQKLKVEPPYIYVTLIPIVDDQNNAGSSIRKNVEVIILAGEAKNNDDVIEPVANIVARFTKIRDILDKPGIRFSNPLVEFDYTVANVIQYIFSFETFYKAI